MDLFFNTEAKLRIANTSEENAKKSSKQAKQRKKLKKHPEKTFVESRRIQFLYLIHDRLRSK